MSRGQDTPPRARFAGMAMRPGTDAGKRRGRRALRQLLCHRPQLRRGDKGVLVTPAACQLACRQHMAALAAMRAAAGVRGMAGPGPGAVRSVRVAGGGGVVFLDGCAAAGFCVFGVERLGQSGSEPMPGAHSANSNAIAHEKPFHPSRLREHRHPVPFTTRVRRNGCVFRGGNPPPDQKVATPRAAEFPTRMSLVDSARSRLRLALSPSCHTLLDSLGEAALLSQTD